MPRSMKRIAILGAGGMGTALALLFDKTEARIRLWSRSEAHAKDLAFGRINDRHLPGILIPEKVLVTACASEAMDGADLIVAAVPSSFLRSILTELSDRVPAGVPFLSVVKGIENGTFDRPSQIIVQTLGERASRGAQRPQPRRGDRAQLARLGRCGRLVDGAQPGNPGMP